MRSADLPAELVASLRRARAVEGVAVGLRQQRFAIHATSSLMLAAVDAGWSCSEIARVLGINANAARARVAAARTRYGDTTPGLVLDEPLPPRPRAFAILDTPIGDREWLSLTEACTFAGVSHATIAQWRRYGLLPNTRRVAYTWLLYLRADLHRVMTAPQFKRGGVDRKALLARIQASPV